MGKDCAGSKRPHTPYMSKAQTIAGNIALAVREGEDSCIKVEGCVEGDGKGDDIDGT